MKAFEEKEYDHEGFQASVWKAFLSYARPYRRYVAALTALMVICGVYDAIYPFMTRHAIDNIIAVGDTEGLIPFAVAFFALASSQAVLIWLFIYLASKIEVGLCRDIRQHGFRHLQELSVSYYDRTPVGWVMARMTSDVNRVGGILAWGMVDFVWGAFLILFAVVAMFVMSPRLALIAVAVIPALMAASFLFQRVILRRHRKVRKHNSMVTAAFNEGITGVRTSKTLSVEAKNDEGFVRLTGEMYGLAVKAIVVSTVFVPVISCIGSVGTALALSLGGGEALAGGISLGTYFAFVSYSLYMLEPAYQMARVFSEFVAAQASAERIIALIKTEPEIKDDPAVLGEYGGVFDPRKGEWPPIEGEVTFEDVTFKYAEGETVLRGFNLRVRKGESVALVGETGSGKSTIVGILTRFYEPTTGRVLIDGRDYRTMPQAWVQSNLGYVLQVPHLFSGTVRDNIAFGKPGATDGEVEAAARLVDAHGFISRLEMGYATEVGEGGGRLSTGEKQLISIARAIIGEPAIFVLDEATSSVDTETERTVQKAISGALKGRTSFIIAHRLSTVRSADRIILISKGAIVEEGSHRELMARKGAYHRLYTNQFVRDAIAAVPKVE
ncbi:MAG: ABC transporter ATP-binding protein/permease [Oscillospiraceae bacterium]|nr:ABC transporter ATP-binding protein/permease [Oscillospiraceae bacterium]